ncbi:hypothetical protein [Anabaena subtropica]|uniref:hypothetical protein n=1 Tax=Anabaena subtropica TaxID=425380 RepID=UPI001F55947D|nr:hypothetical protein [Anabaena subtropica]
MSENSNNDLNLVNKIVDNASQQANHHIYLSVQKRNLAEAAAEIQSLLKQLEQTNPTATEHEQISYVNIATNSDIKQRVITAVKEGGETAIEEFLEHSYFHVIKAIIRHWITPIDNTEKQLRPFGLCAGEFYVPDDFDAPLPKEIINGFEGR